MRVLVANRGEIAIRLVQVLEELSIESVALRTPKDYLHTLIASETIEVPNASTYMNANAIVGYAKKSKCTAIAPDDGYLSESPEMAKLCEDNGIIFIGPSSCVLAELGDKSSAKTKCKGIGYTDSTFGRCENIPGHSNLCRAMGISDHDQGSRWRRRKGHQNC